MINAALYQIWTALNELLRGPSNRLRPVRVHYIYNKEREQRRFM
ncbi:hypothetical protein SAMN05661012_05454 [Chitinophaga sancti]|uniref:Uncharacterized protein n=1 Tax=Chitinophaga sancti TaxID=1004 RepID=A0A1K1SHS3_9BACT|nr:hypothetical protein SAMN05661012_05454 [Chitinophaga sancti]